MGRLTGMGGEVRLCRTFCWFVLFASRASLKYESKTLLLTAVTLSARGGHQGTATVVVSVIMTTRPSQRLALQHGTTLCCMAGKDVHQIRWAQCWGLCSAACITIRSTTAHDMRE